MKNHCAFSKNHSCPLWTDYELTCYELEEAYSLCHGNWIEIERQYKYIQTLQKILFENDIPYLVLCQDLVQVKMRNFSPF